MRAGTGGSRRSVLAPSGNQPAVELLVSAWRSKKSATSSGSKFDRLIDGWRVVNAGSVGVPYEGRAGAYWALLGPDVVLRRTEYDLEAAIAELRGGGFPDVEGLLQESLLEPTRNFVPLLDMLGFGLRTPARCQRD